MNTSPETLAAEFKALIDTAGLPGLDLQPRPQVESPESLLPRVHQFCQTHRLTGTSTALLRGIALLWHDQEPEAHTIAQDIHDREGSWLHAIIHRREPDYSNARYWFHQVGQHPAYAYLAESMSAILPQSTADHLAQKLLPGGKWSASGFVDLCQVALRNRQDTQTIALCQQIQAAEFAALIRHIIEARR